MCEVYRDMHVTQCMYGDQRRAFWSQFSHSTFMWALGIKLRVPGMFGKCLYALNHLASPSPASLCTLRWKVLCRWQRRNSTGLRVFAHEHKSHLLPPKENLPLSFASCHRWTQALWPTFWLEHSSSLSLLPSTASRCPPSWSMLISLPRDRACCCRDWFLVIYLPWPNVNWSILFAW